MCSDYRNCNGGVCSCVLCNSAPQSHTHTLRRLLLYPAGCSWLRARVRLPLCLWLLVSLCVYVCVWDRMIRTRLHLAVCAISAVCSRSGRKYIQLVLVRYTRLLMEFPAIDSFRVCVCVYVYVCVYVNVCVCVYVCLLVWLLLCDWLLNIYNSYIRLEIISGRFNFSIHFLFR